MYTVSDAYKKAMNEPVRQPSLMEITFHFPSGDVIFTNSEIVNFTENKSVHLIADEVPTIDLSIQLKNTDGRFNPNDTVNSPNYHDTIINGIEITYKYGIKTDIGVEWVQGGYAFTDGEIKYDETSATITAYDNLSFLDSPVYYTFSGTQSLSTIATNVIGLTDYLEDVNGNKKIKLGTELDTFITPISIAPTSDKSLSPKQWLQHIAYAGCVKFYIDREGYICLNNDTESASYTQYELPLANQKEKPEHSKIQNPSKLTVVLATDYGDNVEVTLGGGGEELVIEGNPYIVTTASGNDLRDRLINDFLPYRNEADLSYRGEPALDVLDNITFDAPFQNGLHGIITESELVFSGTLEGTLRVRYFLSDVVSYEAGITGATVFNFPYLSTTPIVASLSLTCITGKPTPTFAWNYYLNGIWYVITGETTSILTIAYDSLLFNGENTLKVKCIVSGNKSATTTFTKNYYVASSTSAYQGTIVGTTTSDIETEITTPVIGDSVLLNNTSDVSATYYGETYIYNGVEWIVTELSQYLMLAYKDALALEVASNIHIRVVSLITDLLYATSSFQENAPAGDNAYLHIKYSNDGGLTFTLNTGGDVGDYIGQYSDNIENDSTVVGDYTWARFKGDAGTNGVDAISIQIYSTNGDKFRDGTANTTLQCYVFQGTENITDNVDAVYFNWTRNSTLGTIEDNVWNTSSTARGHKTILLTPTDVIGRSVFSCEVEIV